MDKLMLASIMMIIAISYGATPQLRAIKESFRIVLIQLLTEIALFLMLWQLKLMDKKLDKKLSTIKKDSE